ncbi:MAG: 5'-nucleotidase C-terminal domain-containing protein [Ilumatobacteraceae bacterium]
MQYGGCHPIGCYFPGDPYDGADFPWLAANVSYTTSGKTILPSTWIDEYPHFKVGYIGMTLEGTPELVAQRGIQGLTFSDEVETANAAAASLSAQGVNAIVVLLHEGGLNAGTYDGCDGISGPIVDIATNLDPSIDLVITGHTHQPYVCDIPDPAGHDRLVTSASSFGRVITEVTLTVTKATGDVDRSRTSAVNHLVTRVDPDPTLTAIIDKWKTLSAPVANRVVGSVAEDITRSPNRDTESALANLIADAQLAATAPADLGGAQIALMNPGGVRADLTVAGIAGGEAPGEVTYGEAFAVQPFGNLLVTMDLTGDQLKGVLEQQYVAGRGRPTLILGVSEGLTFDYSASAPEGSKVSNLALNGTPIDPSASYRVTTNNFLADGGDAFTVFTQGTNRLGGGDDLAAFADYLGLNSPVAAPPTDRINEVP